MYSLKSMASLVASNGITLNTKGNVFSTKSSSKNAENKPPIIESKFLNMLKIVSKEKEFRGVEKFNLI